MHKPGPFSNEDTAEPDLTRIELLKWPRNELAAEVESLRKQRDDLLAACEAFRSFDWFNFVKYPLPHTEKWDKLCALFDDAIAKARDDA